MEISENDVEIHNTNKGVIVIGGLPFLDMQALITALEYANISVDEPVTLESIHDNFETLNKMFTECLHNAPDFDIRFAEAGCFLLHKNKLMCRLNTTLTLCDLIGDIVSCIILYQCKANITFPDDNVDQFKINYRSCGPCNV